MIQENDGNLYVRFIYKTEFQQLKELLINPYIFILKQYFFK